MDLWVPLKKNKKNQIKSKHPKKKKKSNDGRESVQIREEREILNFFSLLISFSDLQKFDHRISSGKERKVLYATRATRGYKKKKGISPRIQVKIRKNPNFLFFSDLQRFNRQNFRIKN